MIGSKAQEGKVVLSPEEKDALRQAIAEADAGDFVDGEQVLRELRGQGGPEKAETTD